MPAHTSLSAVALRWILICDWVRSHLFPYLSNKCNQTHSQLRPQLYAIVKKIQTNMHACTYADAYKHLYFPTHRLASLFSIWFNARIYRATHLQKYAHLFPLLTNTSGIYFWIPYKLLVVVVFFMFFFWSGNMQKKFKTIHNTCHIATFAAVGWITWIPWITREGA